MKIFYTILGHIILLAGPITAIIALAHQLRSCRRGSNDLSAEYTKRCNEIADLQGLLRLRDRVRDRVRDPQRRCRPRTKRT